MARLQPMKSWLLDLQKADAPTEEGRQRRARRQRILNVSSAASIYLPRIQALFALLDAIPGAYVDDEDRTTTLRRQDRLFDAQAAAIWHLLEAYLRLVDLEADLQREARRARDLIVPSLKVTQRSWADEALHALEVEKQLPGLEEGLRQFPVIGGTLVDWTQRLVQAGKALGEEHAERALDRATGQVDRSEVTRLRARIEHEIGRLRETLADEAESKHDDADWQGALALVFGYLDELLAAP